MIDEKITAKLSEIESLDRQIGSFDTQTTQNNETLSQKKTILDQLRKERIDTEKNLRAIGIFKFKERKPLKEKLAELDAKIKENDNEITGLQSTIETLSQKKKEAKGKVQLIQTEIEKIKKEEKLYELASGGNPKAQIDLANFYFEEKKQDLALEWLKKAANQGDSQAQLDLAKFYLKTKNQELAVDWLKKAAEQGNEEAKKLALKIEEDTKRIKAASYDLTLW
jgi:chromosome segregation ATPase